MAEETIKFYGAQWCPDCRRSKAFLGEHRIPYQYVDVDQSTGAQDYVKQLNDNKLIIPTILFQDGSILVEPSDAELAEKEEVFRSVVESLQSRIEEQEDAA